MNTKMLNFAAIYEWIAENSAKVSYRNQTEIFELLFGLYTIKEGVHFSAGRISQLLRGNCSLPAEIVTRYQMRDAYIVSLTDGVKTLITIDFPDPPAALAELAQMIEEDDTISVMQKQKILNYADFEGGDASVAWVADVIRFSMLPRRDTHQKSA